MVALCCALPPVAGAQEPTIAARILGEDIALPRLGSGTDPGGQARALAAIVYERAGNEYIRRHGLVATQAEIDEVAQYDVRFRKHDREQRSRKLAELEERLGSPAMSQQERVRAQDFRNALVRLELSDAQDDAQAGEPDAEASGRRYGPAIERWKLAESLYRRYGGSVGLTPSGPYPFGALARLCREFAAAGSIRVYQADLERRLWQIVEGPPQQAVPPAAIDWTPVWRLAIPSSYMPPAQ